MACLNSFYVLLLFYLLPLTEGWGYHTFLKYAVSHRNASNVMQILHNVKF